MDATTFSAMHPDGAGAGARSRSTSAAEALAATLSALNPKELAVEVATSVSNWTSLAVSQCFSRVRGRPQFDEEHQRSLLSCHSTEDDGFGSFPDEEAMLELRRRVQKVDLHAQARPRSFAQELEDTYNRHKAMQHAEVHMKGASVPVRAAPRRRDKAASADAVASPEKGTVWTDTEQALNDILGKDAVQFMRHRASDPGNADELRRLSVDELLSLRVQSPTSTVSIPEKTGSDAEEAESVSTEGRALREWLQAIDAARACEFVGYARSFEQQGFLTLDDLAHLDENDVEHAMSEVGISKFAHRARIRKAILRLPLEGSGGDSEFVQPALAG